MSLNLPNAKLIADSLGTYRRQHLGIKEGGKVIIYVNAFCKYYADRGHKWRIEFVYVQDGGPCYFQVWYDPQAKVFTRLAINGEA